MADKVKIITPEHVVLEFELAGVGSRLMAVLIDILILLGLILGGALLAVLIGLGILRFPESLLSWYAAIFWLLVFLLVWGYFAFFEIRWSGQTPGKRKMRLRVIRDSGHPLDRQAAILRNIVRIPEMFFFAAGFFVLFFSPHSKRLGDYAAGTLVVRVREQDEPVWSPRRPSAVEAPQFQLLDDKALARMERLSRQEYEAIVRFIERAGTLDAGVADDLARKIAEPLMQRLGIESPSFTGGYSYDRLLGEIALAYERSRGH